MLCEKPYMIGSLPCACNRCFPCRVNRRRIWAHRIVLESKVSSDSCFVTLTYAEDYLPKGAGLNPKHVQDWLKRLRKLVAPQKIRYFVVGEYGERSLRPHYHVALFGIHPWLAGGVSGQSGFVARTWGYGFSYVGELNVDSAMYIAGYCTKKMSSISDPKLNGKPKEFTRMSLRPGLGYAAMDDVARAIPAYLRGTYTENDSDVPGSLKHGRKQLPLGRYLRGVLREKLGYASRESSPGSKKKYALQMYTMRKEAQRTQKGSTSIWESLTGQRIRNLKSRTGIYRKEKML